jgi:type VI secretion system secreted protein Hcp
MTKNKNFLRSSLGRIASGAAILLLMAGAQLIFGPASMAAMNAYLRIPGIDGEAADAAHARWIMISSVASGDLKAESALNIGSQSSGSGSGKVAPQAMDANSGMASGKRQHQPFVIVKEVDKASPKLMQAASSGQHFTEVDVDMDGSHYKLSDVTLSVRKAGGSTETVTLNYQQIEMTK